MYKIIQWATGNVGKASLNAILDTPDCELVGAYVYSADKAGKDVGELCGKEKLGVLTTNHADTIIAMQADCVVFNALGDTRDPTASEEMICRLLESGKNVVSTAVSRHIHPASMPADVRARLEDACRKGRSTFHSTGINPGFTFDVLPIAISGVANKIEQFSCVELVDMAHYSSRQIVHEAIGMGKTPDHRSSMERDIHFTEHPYYVSTLLMQDAFGLTFDDVRISNENAVTDKPVQCPWGVVEAGTVAAKRMRLEALREGKVRCVWDIVWRVTDDVAPDWPRGASSWEVNIAGDPAMTCRFDMSSKEHRTVSVLTSMSGVNVIRSVIAAEPGIKTRLDLPISAGGRFV